MNAPAAYRHSSETPLFVLVVLASLGIWTLLIVSIVGIVYTLVIAVFLFLSHLVFIAHIRGSGVRLSEEQFPELYARIRELAMKAGIEKIPDAYLLQSGGALNALAIKLFRSRMIVLFADLLDACEGDETARDMIIAHELAHIRCGHLNGLWFILPGLFVPFLGQAYSRAREYTCDRYGFALCDGREEALMGLVILAAGGRYASRVNVDAFARQGRDLSSGAMAIGRWLSSHPPLCDRVTALVSKYREVKRPPRAGLLRGLTIIFFFLIVPLAVPVVLVIQLYILPQMKKEAYLNQINRDSAELSMLVEELHGRGVAWGEGIDLNLSDSWEKYRPGTPEPIDPYSKGPYLFRQSSEYGYWIVSSGPDGKFKTDDDLVGEYEWDDMEP